MAVILKSYHKLCLQTSSTRKSIFTRFKSFHSCCQSRQFLSRRTPYNFSTTSISVNMSTSANSSKSNNMIAAIQMTSTDQKDVNMKLCNSLIEKAVREQNVKMVFLPEGFDFIASGREDTIKLAETLDGEVITNYRNVAKNLNVWLSLGGFHQKLNDDRVSEEGAKISNLHLVIDADGNIVSKYEKVHLFDVHIPEQNIDLRESRTVHAGNEIVTPVETPVGKVGLLVCYDLRFPEISERLRQEGAQILTYPSAFTVHTGKAHWEILLRARAIENQCYVVAAAQVGVHNSKRSSYGHSMIVDPWGTVISEACGSNELIFAEINLKNLVTRRTEMPIAQHKRYDVYTKRDHKCTIPTFTDDDVFDFGPVKIKTKFSFLESEFSQAFVNAKCIKPGHVLVISKRVVPRLCQLTNQEITDLYLLVQKVGIIMESIQGSTAANVATQDGKEAGQSIPHVHVHVLPRRAGDFANNDDVYPALEEHGKILQEPEPKWRPHDEMWEEAELIRSKIKQDFSHFLK